MTARKVTKAQAEKVLAAVARQLSKNRGGYPVPTGPEAAYNGDGPELNMEWNWSGEPRPTILLESSAFYEWPFELDLPAINREAGVFCEPYSGYALSIFPEYVR